MDEISRDMALLHPRARTAFLELQRKLAVGFETGECAYLFEPFEVWRSIRRQNQLFKEAKTRARGWQSAHNYGLAVDFVPRTAAGWKWDVPPEVWAYLRSQATLCGLHNDIEWDRAHVEHPLFDRVRESLLRAA